MTEAALTQAEIYSARPGILIDGRYIDTVNNLLVSMDLREQENAMTSLELRLQNVNSNEQGGADLAFEDEVDFGFGSQISIMAGDEAAQEEIFSGVITGMEAEFAEEQPPEILILAEDSLQGARMATRTRIYESATVAALVNDIVGPLGITADVDGLTDSGGPWVQLNESDMAFLQRILRRYGACMYFVGNQLHVGLSSPSDSNPVELELYSQLRSVKFIADLAHQITATSVTGWDDNAGRNLDANSSGLNPGPGQGRSGAQLLREAMGERNEHVGHIAVATSQEAQALADAAFDQRANRFITAEGVAEGNAALRVGRNVRLTGVIGRFANTYAVVATHHYYNEHRGYETEFKAQSAYLGNL